jgi:hypothetical protein
MQKEPNRKTGKTIWGKKIKIRPKPFPKPRSRKPSLAALSFTVFAEGRNI